MTPISASEVKDGSFDIMVLSSSRFFKLELSSITSKDGELTATCKHTKAKANNTYILELPKEASKADEI